MPVKGLSYTTAPARVTADKDGNGIHDRWEKDLHGDLGANPQADSDGDGVSNRKEYLFGLDPNQPGSRQPIVAPLDPSSGEFQYSRPVDKLQGVRYQVQISTDLVNWSDAVGYSESTSSANARSEVVTVGLPSTLVRGNQKLFVRVSVQ